MGCAAALPLDLPQACGSFGAVRLTYSQGRSKRIMENFGGVNHGSLDYIREFIYSSGLPSRIFPSCDWNYPDGAWQLRRGASPPRT